MGTLHNAGFTILETMLFLAVSGLLIAGMVTGVGLSIDSQRYGDSVQDFETLVQDQYGQLTNVQIDHGANWSCGLDGTNTVQVTEQQSGGSSYRGQSDCVIIGRYMVINPSNASAGTISTQSVVALPNTSNHLASGTDIQLLQANYNLGLSNTDATTSQMEWGSQITWPVAGPQAHASGTVRSVALLFITSPDSGNTYTFIGTPLTQVTSANLLGMMTAANQVTQTFCINPSTAVSGGARALVIDADASNTTAVQLLTNTQLTGGTQC